MNYENLRRKNFEPEEFFRSDTARKLGISNYPTKEIEHAVIPCLMSTADMMQEIRDLLGHSININSAYRCKIVNDAVGSSDTSQHLQGMAVDFTCSGFGTPEKIMKFLFSKKFLVDQCFSENSWLHISRNIVKDRNRMMYGYYLPDKKTGKRKFKPLK